nr:MAG TPA: hypothetical protein [Caudoviricetes sp.]
MSISNLSTPFFRRDDLAIRGPIPARCNLVRSPLDSSVVSLTFAPIK